MTQVSLEENRPFGPSCVYFLFISSLVLNTLGREFSALILWGGSCASWICCTHFDKFLVIIVLSVVSANFTLSSYVAPVPIIFEFFTVLCISLSLSFRRVALFSPPHHCSTWRLLLARPPVPSQTLLCWMCFWTVLLGS